MSTLIKRFKYLIVFASVLIVAFVSCSEDDNPIIPKQEVGTVVVNPSPDSINAPWILTGPGDYSMSETGDHTIHGLVVGDYSITWGDVSGWVAAPSDTQTLAADETIIFNGAYIEDEKSGTITIDQSPEDLIGAGWSLTGPLNAAGSGDTTLIDMPIGTYTLAWNSVSGYSTPLGDEQTLVDDGTITFSGTYVQQLGTIIIEQSPDDLIGAGWSLSGPLSAAGSGDTTLIDMPIGTYTLAWNPVGGYSTPSGDEQTLVDGGTITFSGTYVQQLGTIVIDQSPDLLAGSGWSLSGPHSLTGVGDATLTNMPIGSYTLIWDDVFGYTTPSRDNQILVDSGTITFSGTYIQQFGTIIIDQTPDLLVGAGWALIGPQVETGSGDAIFTDMPVGKYTLIWYAVNYCSKPANETRFLYDSKTIIFSGRYYKAVQVKEVQPFEADSEGPVNGIPPDLY